jgi:hypothetical protein
MTLAAAARREAEPKLVFEHCQHLPGEVPVVAAPASADQTRAVLAVLKPLLSCLNELEADVIVDCGRLDPKSPPFDIWDRAERRLLAVRPRLSDLQSMATWLESTGSQHGDLALISVGDGPYPDDEISQALGVEVVARVPWDPGAADVIFLVRTEARQLRMAPLVRAARSLGELIIESPRPDGTPEDLDDGGFRQTQNRVSRRGLLRRERSTDEISASNGSAPSEVAT